MSAKELVKFLKPKSALVQLVQVQTIYSVFILEAQKIWTTKEQDKIVFY